MQFIITQCVGNWEQAVAMSKEREMFLPSVEMCQDYNLPECWTCNTDPRDRDFAYLNNGESRHKRLYDCRIVLCFGQYTKQDISYHDGDLKEFNTQWYEELE